MKEKDGAETEIKEDFDPFVVMSDGKLVAVDNNAEDEKFIVHGDLYVNTKVKGKEKDKDDKVKEVELELKSALQLLKEEADTHTIEEWANIADISAEDLCGSLRNLLLTEKSRVRYPSRRFPAHQRLLSMLCIQYAESAHWQLRLGWRLIHSFYL